MNGAIRDRSMGVLSRFAGLISVALVGVHVLGAVAYGQATAPAPEDADAVRKSRAHFERGMELFESRDFRQAVREFTVAASLTPSSDLWFNIARAHEELGEWSEAIEFYRRYLRDRVDPPDRSEVEALIASLAEREEAERVSTLKAPDSGHLRLSVSEAEATVRLDGRAVGRSPLNAVLTLPPGEHSLEVSRPGFIPFRSVIRVEPGVDVAAHAELRPKTEYRAVRGSHVFTWIAGGLTIAALGASAYFGIAAAGQDDAERTTARDQARMSDVFLGTALALGVGTMILYFIEGRSVATERLAPEPPTS